jgi:hypothetical protein
MSLPRSPAPPGAVQADKISNAMTGNQPVILFSWHGQLLSALMAPVNICINK